MCPPDTFLLPHHQPRLTWGSEALTHPPFYSAISNPVPPTPAQLCHRTHSNRFHLQLSPSGIGTQYFRLWRLDKTCLASTTYPLRGCT
eukprot:3419546-Ditylum_brightwellii.AAC.1